MTTQALITVAQDAGRKRRLLRNLPWRGPVTVIAVLAVWQVASMTGLLPESTLPSVTQIGVAFVGLLGQGVFWLSVGQTLVSTFSGLGIVIVIAVPLALILGLSKVARESTWLVIEFLKPIPPVAMIPLGLLLWGPSETMKVTLIAFGALWPFLTQLIYGIRQVDNVAIQMALSYRLGVWLTTSRVILPSLLPFATTGLRVSASIAIIISVVTELIGGAAGLGRQITIAQSSGNIPVMYALIFTTGLLGLLINWLFLMAQKPLLFWHASQRTVVS